MNGNLKWVLFVFLAEIAFSSATSHASNYKGQTCRSTDTDPIKCLVCVQAWEANNSIYRDMKRVVGVVKQRFKSGRYPKNICKIVYQPGQFIGLWHGRVLNKPPKVLAMMVKAAKNARANGHLGFRTGANGENRLKRTANLRSDQPVSLPQYASLKKYTPIAAPPPSIESNYSQTAYLEDDAPAAAAN